MRFNPKAGIDTGRVDDVSGTSSSARRLPFPTSSGGGGRAGLLLMIVSLVVRFLLSRRRTSAATR